MPTYDYQCRKCGHEFEAFQRITDKPLKSCPKCRGRRVRRLVTGGEFMLKGSGFYVTDYRGAAYKKAVEKEKSGTVAAGQGAGKPAPVSSGTATGGKTKPESGKKGAGGKQAAG